MAPFAKKISLQFLQLIRHINNLFLNMRMFFFFFLKKKCLHQSVYFLLSLSLCIMYISKRISRNLFRKIFKKLKKKIFSLPFEDVKTSVRTKIRFWFRRVSVKNKSFIKDSVSAKKVLVRNFNIHSIFSPMKMIKL